MLNNEYYTVNELADYLGITKQAIYKRLKNDLHTYVIEKNGQKLLDKSIVEEFNKNIKIPNQIQQDNYLNELNDYLKKQLKDKETLVEKLFQQIESLTTQIQTLTTEVELQNKHNREQSTQLVELLKQVNELQRNNQVLLAQNNESVIDMSAEKTNQEKSKKLFNWFK